MIAPPTPISTQWFVKGPTENIERDEDLALKAWNHWKAASAVNAIVRAYSSPPVLFEYQKRPMVPKAIIGVRMAILTAEVLSMMNSSDHAEVFLEYVPMSGSIPRGTVHAVSDKVYPENHYCGERQVELYDQRGDKCEDLAQVCRYEEKDNALQVVVDDPALFDRMYYGRKVVVHEYHVGGFL